MADSATHGPRPSKADLLRVANTQVQTAQMDGERLGTVLTLILTGNHDQQAVFNAFGTIRDMQASLTEAYHLLASTVLDPHLRDYPTVYDSHGTPYVYRGCQTNGLCVSNISGEFQHTLRVVDFSDDSFLAEKDHGPVERFTYGTVLSRPVATEAVREVES